MKYGRYGKHPEDIIYNVYTQYTSLWWKSGKGLEESYPPAPKKVKIPIKTNEKLTVLFSHKNIIPNVHGKLLNKIFS